MGVFMHQSPGHVEFQGKTWVISEWDKGETGPHRLVLVDQQGREETLVIQEPTLRRRSPEPARVSSLALAGVAGAEVSPPMEPERVP